MIILEYRLSNNDYKIVLIANSDILGLIEAYCNPLYWGAGNPLHFENRRQENHKWGLPLQNMLKNRGISKVQGGISLSAAYHLEYDSSGSTSQHKADIIPIIAYYVNLLTSIG